MGMKSRLFASAAFPLLSLSLAMSPAHAATAAGGSGMRPTPQVISGSYEVAQDAAPSDEELLKKKRKRPAEQPEAEPQQEAPQAEEEAPRRKQRKAASEAEQAPEAQQAQPSEEQPRRKKRQAAPEQAAPEPQQEQVAPEAAPEQQPAQNRERPRRKQREQQPAQEETAPQQGEAQPQADELQQQTEEAQPEQQRPRKRQQQATEGEQQPAAKPGRKPVKEAQPKQQPAEDKAAVPQESPAPEKAPVPAESPAPKKPPVPAEPGEAQKPAEGGEPLQQQGEQVPVQPVAPTGEQPTGDAQPTEQAIPAPEKVTPEELDRRKQIAEDPSKSNETVVLPVENGAAVLDSDKDADRTSGRGGRRERDRLRAAEQQVIAAPKSDADAQLAPEGQRRPPVKFEAVTSEEGRRLDRRPEFMSPEGARVERYEGDDNRTIIQYNNRIVVRSDDDRRFLRDGERPLYEQLSRDRYRETIERPEGYRIVTIRNRYGDIIQRSRIDSSGREYVLYYSPELYDDPDRGYFEDPGADLPPMRLGIPVRDYIIDTSSNPDRDYYEFLSEPPVEPVERVYSLNEVKYSARIRDKVRRIDLDTITFATGSAEIPMSQARSLRKVADAMNEVLQKDQSETFLIEGHTDAVGSDESNLVLSDQRAESVANVLTDVYGIPPENLATQGYGERYLKVNVDGPEQENRRVTIRRVTALVRPVASNQ
ncbi:Outer membrane protein OmpA [Rhizobium mongolense subsp. loessense]|uniref:Outer membrane protein OmpA n=1 Tax=Rhizobium mongolense subsp. loessense TaxID=158890 RepID=A0A1G4RKP4_9HYPH|nr:OmpA family protein [Rhizobium mongolense]SCW57533.1 Outer membrane protein OmpA [Rhizobium mongolense subsp. loessense]